MFGSVEEAIKFAKNDDDGGVPIFEHKAVEIPHSDPVKYEDKVWVTIINRGDPKTIIERPKRPEDEKRWPDHWKAFLEGSEAPLNGIPLEEFPALTPADIATCKRYHVRTVEELADYPDGQIKNLGDRGFSLKKAAKTFIDYREGDKGALLARIAELEAKVDSTDDHQQRAGGDQPGERGDTVKRNATTAKRKRKKARKKTVA